VNQQGGISSTNSGGMNYVSQWGPKLSVSASAFVNGTKNENTNALDREYLPPQDSIASFEQLQGSEN